MIIYVTFQRKLGFNSVTKLMMLTKYYKYFIPQICVHINLGNAVDCRLFSQMYMISNIYPIMNRCDLS